MNEVSIFTNKYELESINIAADIANLSVEDFMLAASLTQAYETIMKADYK